VCRRFMLPARGWDVMRLPLKTCVCVTMSMLPVWLAMALLMITAPFVIRSMWLRAGSENYISRIETKTTERTEVQLGDRYGGTTVHVQKGTGYFTIAKVGSRWTFVTPEGNAFWLRSVYATNRAFMQSSVLAKYGGDWNKWYTHRNQRLLSWGFNALGEYNVGQGLPIDAYGLKNANPVKLPFIAEINGIVQMVVHPTMYGIPEAPKDVIKGVPTTTYKGWRGGHLVDVFDPKIATGYRNVVAYENNRVYSAGKGGFDTIPWLIGLTMDDTDYLFGLKNSGSSPVSPHSHIGYLTACTKFQYTAAEFGSITPRDPKLYTKYAWVDMLRAKYGTIQALNAAWGSNYTSFDDNGGYGVGTGLIDEDGRHSWIGRDPLLLRGTNPNAAADMDAFLYKYTYQYATTAITAIRAYDRHHMIFGPMAFSAGGYMNRPQVLRAFDDAGVDAFQMSVSSNADMSGHRATYDLTGKPIYLWYGVSANADSALHAYKQNQGVADLPTQPARAQQYASDLEAFFSVKGSKGDNFILGIDWWELSDGNAYEKTNWGLITRNDNAYDGKEAVRGPGTDQWGLHTGGEDRDYGDFLSGVRATNFEIQERLARDLTPFAQSPAKSKK